MSTLNYGNFETGVTELYLRKRRYARKKGTCPTLRQMVNTKQQLRSEIKTWFIVFGVLH